MKRFLVEVHAYLGDTIPVDAVDGADAMLIAENVLRARLLPWRPCSSDFSLTVEPIAAQEVADARTVTQTCTHCSTTTPKEFWGPGWMTCPACSKRPMSAGEVYGVLRLLADACDPANPKVTLDAIVTAERAGYVEAVKAARALLAEREIIAP